MLRNIFKMSIIALLFASSLCANSNKPLIGLIMPMEHQALNDITKGFEEELTHLAPEKYEIAVFNAQGDASLQMALLQNLIRKKCAIFVPIGTSTTQMTLNVVKSGSIVSLAANLPKGIQSTHNVPLTGVLDEIPMKEHMRFLKTLIPDLRKCTLIHSGAEKIHDELQELQRAAQQENVYIQLLMAQTMTDLATCTKNIDSDSQCIFILKDHLIVSGINVLVKQAQTLKIPLVTSDEGSVKGGATIALGVKESDIGRAGAKLVHSILNGAVAKDLPITTVKNATIFVNPHHPYLAQEVIDLASRQLHYTISYTQGEQYAVKRS